MNTVYFVDLDKTVIPDGRARDVIPHAKARLDKIAEDPNNHIYFFSCWAFTADDQAFLQRAFPYAKGFIRKPLADYYCFIDDKHDVSRSWIESGHFFACISANQEAGKTGTTV